MEINWYSFRKDNQNIDLYKLFDFLYPHASAEFFNFSSSYFADIENISGIRSRQVAAKIMVDVKVLHEMYERVSIPAN